MVNSLRAEHYGIDDLVDIMARLRAPGGCPWDRAQTHASIRRNMLEEAYEAAEAIDQEDPGHLREELGDVLLQVVFHARLSEEAGQFNFDDVVDGICRKLIYRHPHVFGGESAPDPAAALNVWDAQKRVEKGQATAGDALDAVARSLPALMRAEKLQSKAEKAGLVPPDTAPEQTALTAAALAAVPPEQRGRTLGALLFSCAEAGRAAGLEPEECLQSACEDFILRFRRMEEQESRDQGSCGNRT